MGFFMTVRARMAMRFGFTGAAVLALSSLLTVAFAGPDEPTPALTGANIEATSIRSVVELFTSQGCDSCPPADALMVKLAERKDVLALSMHVDYWDYLGWKDTLANPKYTERQRTYAKARNDGQVYTPQAVINGVAHANGASARDIDAALRDTALPLDSSRVTLRFWTDRDTLQIEAEGAAAGANVVEATVWLAVVQRRADVVIERGENRGKTIAYVNVVRDLTPVGTWTGRPMKIQLPRSALMRQGLDSVAVFLQQGKAGPIVAAAATGLW
jgi:hypothetical protein